MVPIYRHTQQAWTIRAFLVFGALLVTMVVLPEGAWTVLLAAFGALALVAVLFGSLTVIVDETAVRWHFGPGFWHKSMALAEVTAARSVANRWWYGWGIRVIPGGWLYNVSGLRAVELDRADGGKVRLGSDEPERLEEAIRQALDLHR